MTSNDITSSLSDQFSIPTFCSKTKTLSGITESGTKLTTTSTDPAHVIRFDEADDLNKRLEELYNTKKYDSTHITKEPQLAFADYGLGGFNTNIPATSSDTNDKICSADEKEDNDMANYGYNVDGDSSIFSFATVPQERALAPQRGFSDVLFMDIPWDTKVDIWGGIKSFINAEVKFTF